MRSVSLLLLLAFAASSMAEQQESDADRYSDTARQALATKHWNEAAQALEHLARLAPNTAEVHANLGLAYYFKESRATLSSHLSVREP